MKKSPIPLGLDGIYIGRDQSALSSELNEGKSRLNNSSNNNNLNNLNNNNSSNNIINKNISTKNISSNNNNANNANNNGIFKPVNLSPTRPPLSPPNTNKKYVLPSTVRIDQNISPSRIQQQQTQIQQTQLNVINENDNTSIHSSSTTSSSSSSSNNSNINKDNNNNNNNNHKTGIASNSSNVGKNLPNNVFPSPISTANIDRTTSPPPPLPPSHSSSSPPPPTTTTTSTKISKNEQERISPTPKKIVPSQQQQQQQQQQGSKSQPSSNKNSPKSSPKTKNKSPQPSPKTNKKNISTEKKTNTINSQRSKSPKQENKNDGLVGKTLRSQKMEMRIKSAVENEDISVTSSSSSGTDDNQEHTSVTSSSSSASNSNSTSTSPSRNKIYEPDMNTYGLNGSLATRTKRMLEKQAKIEGFDKNNERRNGKKDEKQEHEIKDLSQTDSTTSKTKQNEKDNHNNNNNNSSSSSKIKDNSTDSIIVNEIFDDPNSKEELKIPQSNPLQLPYPTSPYPPYFYNYHPNYPQSLPNYPPGYGIPPYYHQYPHQLQTGPNTLSPNGYPPYPGNPYYPYPFPDPNNPAFLLQQQQQQQMPSSPSLSSTIASLSNLQSSNTDLQSMMLMNQLGAISKQLSGLNNTTVDSEEYLNLMKIFQQITSGLMEQSTLFQQQQFHNETAENERRLKQEDLTRMLQNQINSLQNQLQEHLRKMEEEKRLFEEKERELRLKELREREERERLREIQERQEKEDREQRERIEREEREEREKLRIQAENQVKEERERIRLLREQQEKDEKERLRELREKIEQKEREERERLREIREREEREERERLKEIRERVEREEREEKERLREIRERIEKEEREEMERLRIIREREEKEALQRKLQREAQELEEARLRNLSQESDGGASLATVVNAIRYKHKSPYDDDQLTPEMREMAEEHRRRTGKELPRVLYRLVPHRSKFRRANELFDSNIHVDRVAEDDESLHSYTSESIRHILTKQYSTNTNTSSRISSSSSTSSNSRNSNSSSSQILQHQQSLPINFNKTIITDPIVLPQQTRFSCDNPLLNSKDDFWIEPKLSITAENSSPETSPTTDRSSNTNLSGYSFFGASYDSIKKILRRKSLWSDTPPEIPLPLNINIDNIPIDKKRMKRGSKDDLEIERKTNLLSLSAAHLRHVNLTSSSTVRHKKSE